MEHDLRMAGVKHSEARVAVLWWRMMSSLMANWLTCSVENQHEHEVGKYHEVETIRNEIRVMVWKPGTTHDVRTCLAWKKSGP